jgi:hypothetical protein
MTAAKSSSVGACARFLVELENTCAAFRLYGAAHPAFARASEAAAAAVATVPLRVSVAAGGFASEEAAIDDPSLRGLARRLRLMGLVGLDVESKPTATHVAALVPLLAGGGSAEVATDAIVERIAQATGNTIRVIPLRLSSLRLVRGAAPTNSGKNLARPDEPPSWRDLLSRACTGGLDEPEVRELAQSFEAALGAKPSEAQWNAMVDVWSRQLAHAHAQQASASAASPPGETSPAATDPGSRPTAGPADDPFASTRSVWDTLGAAGGGGGGDEPGAGHPLDAVGHFLQALSPNLSRRLLSETIQDQQVPEPLVMSLAQRLPTTVVLGALSAVDRDNGSPSQAAMALLRKVAAQAGTQGDANAPRTNEELAATAAALERLLQSSKDSAFVPDEYLRRRDELSRGALAPHRGATGCPTPTDTARHAAELVLQILVSPQSEPSHVLAALLFVGQRIVPWVRAGELPRAAEALAAARALCGSDDAANAGAARSVVGIPLGVDDLHEGARQFGGEGTHVADAIAGLLRQCDGATLASLLRSNRLKNGAPGRSAGGGGEDVVVSAIRTALADAPDHCIKGLFDAVSDKPPPALLAVLDHLSADAHVKAVAAAVPHCTPPVRKALLQQVFKRNIAWPVELTEHLLKDTDKDVRRMAVMRLARDADAKTCARHLELACGADEYEADVAAWLAELMRPRRKHPDVRGAWRRWTWSKRRWAAILFIKVTFPKRNGKGGGK